MYFGFGYVRESVGRFLWVGDPTGQFYFSVGATIGRQFITHNTMYLESNALPYELNGQTNRPKKSPRAIFFRLTFKQSAAAA
jgi:hypothetical protein